MVSWGPIANTWPLDFPVNLPFSTAVSLSPRCLGHKRLRSPVSFWILMFHNPMHIYSCYWTYWTFSCFTLSSFHHGDYWLWWLLIATLCSLTSRLAFGIAPLFCLHNDFCSLCNKKERKRKRKIKLKCWFYNTSMKGIVSVSLTEQLNCLTLSFQQPSPGENLGSCSILSAWWVNGWLSE